MSLDSARLRHRWTTLLVPLVVAVRVGSIAVTPGLAESPELLQALEDHAAPGRVAPVSPGSLFEQPGLLPDAIETGVRYELSRHGENRGLRLDVLSATLEPRYGGRAAAAGHAFLVLDTMWECQVAFDLVLDLDHEEAVQIPALSRQCFLIIDGKRTVRVARPIGGAPEEIPESFLLSGAGSLAQGRVAFEIPRDGFQSLELRFYHARYGPIAIALRGAGPSGSPPPSVAGPKRNSVVELGVHAFARMPEYRGRAAPIGMTHAVADVRGRSLLTRATDARALDEMADAAATTEIGVVFEYLRAADTIHALVDGEYAYPPEEELSGAAQDLPFLPDATSGGSWVFLVPERASSIELVCEFAEMKMTTGERLGTPDALRFSLFGETGPIPQRRAVAAIADEPVSVGLMAARLTDEFAGRPPPGGSRFAVLDITVRHEGPEQGLYAIASRFHLEAGTGRPLSVDEATYAGAYRPPRRPLWLTPGARRSFQLVYAVPDGTRTARLAYAGVASSAAIVVDFDEASGTTVAAGASTMRRPDESFEESDAVVAKAEAATEVPAPSGGVSREPKGLAGVGVTAREVDEAIDRGRAFLWKTILEEDLKGRLAEFPSRREHTIAALALVHSDASTAFPDFDRALRGWLGGGDSRDPNAPPNAGRRAMFADGQTYAGSIYCMTIDAYGDPFFFPALEATAKSLVEGQFASGAWSYTIPRAGDSTSAEPSSSALTVLGGGSDRTSLTREREWEDKSGDNSATQFALLGLRAAHRRGMRAPDETWERALGLYSGRQGPDGGWSYHTGSSYGSMTCAGTCSIILSGWALGRERPEAHPAIPGGLSWLARNFSVTRNPKHASHRFYYLYSLERVGRLFDTELIGESEWYPLGVKALLGMQEEDGGWVEDYERLVPTSFALLFLTRATEKLIEDEPEGPGTLRVAVRPRPASRLYLILDASGSMLGRIGGRTKFEIARDCVEGLVALLPAEQQVALRVYGHRKTAIEKDADRDTALELPMNAWTAVQRGKLTSALRSLRPRGKTPLALSLTEAARDLARLGAGARNTVLLLTDGGEDTGTGQDPVEAAAALAKRKDTEVMVVGFDVDNPSAVRQLRGIAEAAGGTYWPARRPESLGAALRAAARQAPESWSVLDGSGTPVSRAAIGASLVLDPGEYRVSVPFGGVELTREVRISRGRRTTVVLDPTAVRPESIGASGEIEPAAPAPEPASKARFCTQCGAKATPGASFCTGCGTRL